MARATPDPADSPGRPGTRTAAAKLGLRSGARVALVAAPSGWLPGGTPTDVQLVDDVEVAAVVILFARSQAELDARAPALAAAIFPERALWIAWPRRAGGHKSDMTDNSIRSALVAIGLVDTKVAALDTDWSGLRFVWPLASRAPARGER